MNRISFYLAALLLHLAVLFMTKPPRGNVSLQEEKKYLEVTLTLDQPPSRANSDNVNQPKSTAPSQDLVAPEQPKAPEATPTGSNPGRAKSEANPPEQRQQTPPLVEVPPSSKPSNDSAPSKGAENVATWSPVASTVIAPAAQQRTDGNTPQPGAQFNFGPVTPGSNNSPVAPVSQPVQVGQSVNLGNSGFKSGSGFGNSGFKSSSGSQLSGASLSSSGSNAPGPATIGVNANRTSSTPGFLSSDGGLASRDGINPHEDVQHNLKPVTLGPVLLDHNVINGIDPKLDLQHNLKPVTLKPVTLKPVTLNATNLNDGILKGIEVDPANMKVGSVGGANQTNPTPTGSNLTINNSTVIPGYVPYGNDTPVVTNSTPVSIMAADNTGGEGGSSSANNPNELVPGEVVYFAESKTRQGHYFQPVYAPSGVTWGVAQATAASHKGYLAMIHSTAENNFVFKLIDDPKFWVGNSNGNKTNLGPWLGGVRATDSLMPGDGWIWLKDGSTLSYSNWAAGQPLRGSKAGNDYLRYYSEKLDVRRPTWNDAGASEQMHGFVVEYNTDPSPQPAQP